MDKEFYDKYSKALECSHCPCLQDCMERNEPIKISCAMVFFKDKVKNLKTKLAEKEKEKQDWIRAFEELALDSIDHESYNSTVDEYEKEIEELKISQNQTAIAELEKAKEVFTKDYKGCREIHAKFIYNIDQQIKSLKGDADDN